MCLDLATEQPLLKRVNTSTVCCNYNSYNYFSIEWRTKNFIKNLPALIKAY